MRQMPAMMVLLSTSGGRTALNRTMAASRGELAAAAAAEHEEAVSATLGRVQDGVNNHKVWLIMCVIS